METHHFYLMGKSTISMAMFNSFLYVYHFGYPLPLWPTFGEISESFH